MVLAQQGSPPGLRASIFQSFDGVVAVSGRADFSVLQDADDELDAAAYSLYVKQGSYAAGLTISTNNVIVIIEPGTTITGAVVLSGDGIKMIMGPACVITGAVTLSGDNVTLEMGAGGDIQGVLTLSGANDTVRFENGVTTINVVMSGTFPVLDGGGWASICSGATEHGIKLTGDDGAIRNIAASSTAGGGNAKMGVNVSGARPVVQNVKIIASDDDGIALQSTARDGVVYGCLVLGADDVGIIISGPRNRVIGNYVIATGGDGIQGGSQGDNSVFVGNTVKDATGDAIEITANCEDCIVDGNRTDGAVVDNSGTSTAGDNEATAF